VTGPDLLSLPWRTGRHLGRTIYARLGPEASGEDPVLGMMDTRELAEEAVRAHNRRLEMEGTTGGSEDGP